MNQVITPLDKEWANIRAQFALHRVQAYRTDGEDGPRTYFTLCNGVARAYPDLATLRARLEDLEGVTQ